MNKNPTRIDKTLLVLFVTLFVTHNPVEPPHEHIHTEIVLTKKPKEIAKVKWSLFKMFEKRKF
jgi:hypothetical protein